jgi:hypothetical protein
MRHVKFLIQKFVAVAFALLIVVSCTDKPIDDSEIKLDPVLFEGATPNVPGIVQSVESRVHEELPAANLVGINFQGPCQNLPGLQGAIHLEFAQKRMGMLRTEYWVGLANVDTSTQMLSLRYRDWSDHPLTADPMSLDKGLSMPEIAVLAHKHIEQREVGDCEVTLGHFGKSWHVLCTPPGSGAVGRRLCEFQLDATTGEVIPDR